MIILAVDTPQSLQLSHTVAPEPATEVIQMQVAPTATYPSYRPRGCVKPIGLRTCGVPRYNLYYCYYHEVMREK